METDIGPEYLATVFMWVLALAVILARAWGKFPSVGIVLAYWLTMAINHLFGGLIQILPWHYNVNKSDSLRGFALTGYAMAGLLVGLLLFRPGVLLPRATVRPTLRPPGAARDLGKVCIGAGIVIYFFLTGLFHFIPSLTAVLSNGLNLCVAGFCLAWWFNYRNGRRVAAWVFAAAAMLLPVFTVLLAGFIGFGVFAVLTLGCFMAVGGVSRRTVIVGGIALGFASLSLWVVYHGVRGEVRAAVWGGLSMEERTAVTSSKIQENWSWFDIGSDAHLNAIEDRLNQNWLAGAARRRIENQKADFAEGETFWNALVALIPRIIWPNKPTFAGSGILVTRFTGIVFGASTSVGIGHVMELYVNFGEWGVFLGFFVVAGLLSIIDLAAAKRLREGNFEGFLLCYLPGLTLLLAGGVIAEIPPAAVGSILLGLLITRYVMPYLAPQARLQGQIRPSASLPSRKLPI